MKFGKVDNPEIIDFTIPDTHPDTTRVLKDGKNNITIEVYSNNELIDESETTFLGPGK